MFMSELRPCWWRAPVLHGVKLLPAFNLNFAAAWLAVLNRSGAKLLLHVRSHTARVVEAGFDQRDCSNRSGSRLKCLHPHLSGAGAFRVRALQALPGWGIQRGFAARAYDGLTMVAVAGGRKPY